jgi:hypothetical protein
MTRHRPILLSVTVACSVVLLLVFSGGCATPAAVPYSVSGDQFLTQAASNYAAATAVAQATQECLQLTAEARSATTQAEDARVRQTAEAREEYFFEQTQTAVAGQTTATAEAQVAATAAAIAQATSTARAEATSTAAAFARATETVQAQATGTAVAYAEATAVAAPIRTAEARQAAREQAAMETELERLEWEQCTAPVLYILEMLFWVVLVLIGLATLVWAIPRLYHLLALRLASRGGENGDKVVYFVPLVGGIKEAWTGLPRLLAYDPDRDAGPGQVIEAEVVESGPLPGGDPAVTMRDQAIDLVHRPVVAGGRRPSQRTMRQIAEPERRPIPGLRNVYTLRRLDQAGRAGLLPPALVAALEADWEEVE